MQETTTQTPPEIQEAALARGIGDPARAKQIADIFSPLWDRACEAVSLASKLDVTDATQVTEMKAARSQRLVLRDIRLAADKHRKIQKEAAQREAGAIQAVYNCIEKIIEPEETRLEACEKFAERAEAARKAAVADARKRELEAVGFGGVAYAYNLGEMPAAEWDALIAAKRAERDAADRAAADRAAKDAAERAEREAEYARLREAARKSEADARAARDEAAAQAAKARQAAEEAARTTRALEDARRAAATAGTQPGPTAPPLRLTGATGVEADRRVAVDFAAWLVRVRIPEFGTPGGARLGKLIAEEVAALAEWVRGEAGALEDEEAP